MSHLIATFFYVGHARPGPGTWGSLAALPVALALHLAGGPVLLALAALALFGAGLWATGRETAGGSDDDPSEIVVDEVVGQWIALLPVSAGAAAMGAEPLRLWPGIVAAFLLFRLFDIWKPWLVGRADRRGDAMGVMLDDVWAGAFAALGFVVLALIWHWGVIF